jgi:low temperature requirement protein LtrA
VSHGDLQRWAALRLLWLQTTWYASNCTKRRSYNSFLLGIEALGLRFFLTVFCLCLFFLQTFFLSTASNVSVFTVWTTGTLTPTRAQLLYQFVSLTLNDAAGLLTLSPQREKPQCPLCGQLLVVGPRSDPNDIVRMRRL